MKILYCIPHLYNAGGMERVLTQKVNWLAAHTEHTFTILTTENTPKGLSQTYFPLSKKVDVVALNIDFNADYNKPLFSKWMGHMRRMRQYKKALAQFIPANRIDLCISLGGKEIAFLYTLPCRTMAEMHFAKDQRRQLLETSHKNWFWTCLGNIRTSQLVRAVKPLEKLIVLTEKDKTDWQSSGCNNVIVIPNPCSLDGQKVSMESKKSKVVLAVGRLHEQKGFDLLLRAWEYIEKKYADWSLRIVGEGPQRHALEKQIADFALRRVELVGQTSDVVEQYSSASLYVLSSRYEGLPLALIEAMWMGLPCIAFDCLQGPAELLANGRGWLVANGDVIALGQRIEYAIKHQDEAAELAQKAQAFAQQTYSESAIMPQWVQLIES